MRGRHIPNKLLFPPTAKYYISLKLFTCGLCEIYVDSFQLQIWVAMVGTCGVNSMLVWDHFPEL